MILIVNHVKYRTTQARPTNTCEGCTAYDDGSLCYALIRTMRAQMDDPYQGCPDKSVWEKAP